MEPEDVLIMDKYLMAISFHSYEKYIEVQYNTLIRKYKVYKKSSITQEIR